MEAKSSSAYTVTGWTMLGAVMTGPTTGWNLWKFVSSRMGITEDIEENPRAYRDFKRSLTELAELGHISSTGKGRTRVRLTWVASPAGLQWWEDEGVSRHGPSRSAQESGDASSPPLKKWLGQGRMTRGQWSTMMKKVQAGELEVAFRVTQGE